MTFFYPLKNKHAFGIFDKVTKRKKVKQSTYGARRTSYVCNPLLVRVEVGPRRFELRTSAV